MTTEYLRGEVLHLLNWAQQTGPHCHQTDRTVGALREEAESVQVNDLSWVVERALIIAEAWCFDALDTEDADAFRDRCRLAAALYDFGICSNLLARHSAKNPGASSTIWRKGTWP
jgi:hypothetical protein